MHITSVSAFKDNYVWLLINDDGTAICVDPGDATPVINYLNAKKLTLRAILLTHHHADHVGGVADLCDYQSGIEIYGPMDSRLSYVTHRLHHEEMVNLSPWHFKILSIPGHTTSHICFWEKTQGLLFCGDTLFSAGCGRVFDGTIEQLYESLNLLKSLPDSTKIYCGHEYTYNNLRFAANVEPKNEKIRNYLKTLTSDTTFCTLPSTLGLEKQINPFLRLNQISVQQYAQKQGCTLLDEMSVFKQIRHDKDFFI